MTLTALDIFVIVLIVAVAMAIVFILLRRGDVVRTREYKDAIDDLNEYLTKSDAACDNLTKLTNSSTLLIALRDGEEILENSEITKVLDESIRNHIDTTVKDRICGLVDMYVKANTKTFDQENAADMLQKTQPVSLTLMIPMANLNILQRMVEDTKTPGREQLIAALRYIMFIPCNSTMFNVSNTSAIDRGLLPGNVIFTWRGYNGKDIITGCKMSGVRYNETRNNWVNVSVTITTTSKQYDSATKWVLYELTKEYPRIDNLKDLIRYLMTMPNPTAALND